MHIIGERKWPAVDLMKLYATCTPQRWVAFLQKCLDNGNIDELMKMRYGIQAGMDLLAKQKLNHEKICVLFVRLNRSLEKTARKILIQKHPLPNVHNPKNKATYLQDVLKAKRKRDHEFAEFMKRSSF